MSFSLKIIYDYFTPAFRAGGPSQSLFNLVSSLGPNKGLGTDIKVICTDEDLGGTQLEVPDDVWTDIPTIAGANAKVWYASKRGGRNIDRLIEDQDVLYINSIFSHNFSYASLIRGRGKRKIIAPRGMLDPGSLGQKAWKKKLYLASWKLRGFPGRVEWHATTEQEKSNIQQVFGQTAKVWTVPNFPRVMNGIVPVKGPDVLELITVALISPMKNHLLVLKALKHVSARVLYHIYGPVKDSAYWNECLSLIEELPGNITVEYHGDVNPEKMQQALGNGHVAVLPSKSENFGHSIFEAFTAGKPVITSHTTPWNNLREERAGLNVGIDDELEIATAISFFAAMSQEEFQHWSSSARLFAMRAIDLEAIRSRYIAMFEGIG